MSDIISCREVMGLTLCTYKTDKIMFNSQIDVDIYTSDHCPWCAPTINKINHVLSPLKNMVNINVIDDIERAKDEKVNTFPTTRIGSTEIIGVPDDDLIWNAIFNASDGI